MINMTNRTNIAVRLVPLKLRFRHRLSSLIPVFVPFSRSL
jgi:hypothetical protein